MRVFWASVLSGVICVVPGAFLGTIVAELAYIDLDFARTALVPLGLPIELTRPPWWGTAAGGVIGLLIGFVAGAMKAKQAAALAEELRSVAGRIGAQFSEEDVELTARLRSDFPGARIVFDNVIRKSVNGLDLAAGELSIASGSEGDSTTQSAVHFESKHLRFPQFTLQPQAFGLKLLVGSMGVNNVGFPEHAEFGRLYNLSAVEAARARVLFSEKVRAWLLARPGLHIQSGGNSLFFFRSEEMVEPARIPAFLAQAAEIFRLLEDVQRAKQPSGARIATGISGSG